LPLQRELYIQSQHLMDHGIENGLHLVPILQADLLLSFLDQIDLLDGVKEMGYEDGGVETIVHGIIAFLPPCRYIKIRFPPGFEPVYGSHGLHQSVVSLLRGLQGLVAQVQNTGIMGLHHKESYHRRAIGLAENSVPPAEDL